MTPWWKNAVVYQIYPKSFQDSNGDGIGDLQGIISRLDYLEKLGVDAIWLCPIYKSPGADNGYDIADYEAIDEQFGTMADLDELIQKAHQHHIRIVMDLVVNHTSDEHKWFIESRKSRENPYHDFYVWRDKPNKLTSAFSGSAWQYDEATKQYYLHLFAKKQPDLNWKNPKLRQKIYDMMNFWIDKGIAGFRMDVIECIGKEPDQEITANGPHLHEYLQEMNRETFGKKDFLTVGETWSASLAEAKKYIDPKRHELSMVFQFEANSLDQVGASKWDLKKPDLAELKAILTKWQENLAWNSLFWENHDIPRVISRFGDDGKYRVEAAKMFAIMLHLLKGTPYIFNGEEIGMTNCPVESIDDVNDIESRNMYFAGLEQGKSKAELLRSINAKGRDNARTPMQWDDSANAGFTTGKPWLHLNPNYRAINVKACLADKNSIFYTYQQLIKMRHSYPMLVDGDFKAVATSDNIFAYERVLDNEKWLVVCNLTKKEATFTSEYKIQNVLISNYPARTTLQGITLKPFEAFACQVTC
ncbi:glycoside hydrolase family 13 protein [Lactobacillus psittaci]|uniref:Oligo-1,6-glucosidase n=1 Tax=Lactobacillus psittaci DSM 15354 TaxID=1122152 RepID=A0A0R1S9N8_9LACO|nr:alpha-glucosidase [Lactobacillus psittaci]KRL62155.1 oligo-1,6-glucosidase [Lactobacillus psittaci DSM 15354]